MLCSADYKDNPYQKRSQVYWKKAVRKQSRIDYIYPTCSLFVHSHIYVSYLTLILYDERTELQMWIVNYNYVHVLGNIMSCNKFMSVYHYSLLLAFTVLASDLLWTATITRPFLHRQCCHVDQPLPCQHNWSWIFTTQHSRIWSSYTKGKHAHASGVTVKVENK